MNKNIALALVLGSVVLILALLAVGFATRRNANDGDRYLSSNDRPPIMRPIKEKRRAASAVQDTKANLEQGRKEPILPNSRVWEPKSGPLTLEDADQLARMMDKRTLKKEGELLTLHYHEIPKKEREIVDKVIVFVVRRARDLFGDDQLQPESAIVHSRGYGSQVEPHADNVKWSKEEQKWIYNQIPWISHTGLLYFGGNYEGGELYFANDPEKQYKGTLNDVMYITSGKENVHAVNKITSGRRYAIIICCSNQETRRKWGK
jgi:hypothetical protein